MESLEAIGLVLSIAATWLAVTLIMLTRIHTPARARRRPKVAAPPGDPAQPRAPRSFRALVKASRRSSGSASAGYAPAWRRRTPGRDALGRNTPGRNTPGRDGVHAENREGSLAS